ncbi:MFS transporter [Roseateles sp. DAIF2]|uniref:MFS transporter n=1 Tax=Roseateles sp. DAIF2 TaxID=2714952 RepID=UPI0018A2A3E6|nr:MFS transporter [Roseateles sp. DAIF2]QPF76367.1 MFS transporter [Roseateles sp. DAIF2]
MPLPIIALALAAFAIGTTEFVIMGILPEVARDLGVDLPAAGLLVSGYALGVALGAPLVALATARWPRKTTLLVLMGLFIAGNLLSALAPGYGLLMAGRVLASLAHGSFFGIGAVVASGLVAPTRRAAAVALMFTGLTLANVLGVPLGTWIGQGWGWRATFWTVSVLGVLALVAVAALVPRAGRAAAGEGGASEWRVLRDRQVLAALGLTVLGFGGIFTAFTYIAPLLREQTGLAPGAVTGVLCLFGLGLTLGNVLGGRLADRWPRGSMLGILAALAAVEALLALTATRPLPAIATVFAWGIAAFATVPGLQMRVLERAGAAPTLASTLNIGAFNLGNAGGAWLGGALLAADWSLRSLPLAAAALALLALALAAVGGSSPATSSSSLQLVKES